MPPYLYIDNEENDDPATNLAIEEYVLRHLDPARDYMLLTRNTPSVIIGRNQNPLEEVNDTCVRKMGIPVLRRISGGGTVYHDPGNLNFSFITRYESSRLHNFPFFNEPVVQILQSLGIPAEMNDRNDILARGRKISGSAQFSSKGRMLSHGTLLYNAQLDALEQVLTVTSQHIRSRSHKSVRSSVVNMSEFLDQPMTPDSFRDRLLQGLRNSGVAYGHHRLDEKDWREIDRIRRDRYLSWEWNTGRTPRFEINRTLRLEKTSVRLHLEVYKGIIRHVSLQPLQTDEPAGEGERNADRTAGYIPNSGKAYFRAKHPEPENHLTEDHPRNSSKVLLRDLHTVQEALPGIRFDPVEITAALERKPELLQPDSLSPGQWADRIYGTTDS